MKNASSNFAALIGGKLLLWNASECFRSEFRLEKQQNSTYDSSFLKNVNDTSSNLEECCCDTSQIGKKLMASEFFKISDQNSDRNYDLPFSQNEAVINYGFGILQDFRSEF